MQRSQVLTTNPPSAEHDPITRRTLRLAGLGLLAVLSTQAVPAAAAEALMAVAANFATTAADLTTAFERHSAHRMVLAAGSTGKLYAQIRNGAPYDLFLAADQVRPERLETEGFAVPGSRSTYACGQLGIWIRGAGRDTAEHPIRLTDLRRIAIANPDLAPYGMAAMSTIEHLSLKDELADRLAMGENVAQAYAMIASGAADGGFVAWSLILAGDKVSQSWPVPESWHQAINQDVVLLNHGAENPAARAFLAFLSSPAARAIIRRQGYSVPDA